MEFSAEVDWELSDLADQTESNDKNVSLSSVRQSYLTEQDIIQQGVQKVRPVALEPVSNDDWYKEVGKSFEVC